MNDKTFCIRTYGCQMNASDSERICGTLIDQGYSMVASAEEAGLVVLNTCSIRDGAENKVYSDIGRLRLMGKQAGHAPTIAVAGCVAQQEGEKLLARAPEVGLVFGSRAISELPGLIARAEAGEQVAELDIHDRPDAAPHHVRDDPYRAFVTIMEGCDNHCAFCVVPTTRGPEVSRAPQGILDEVRHLAATGYVEVTLLGQNVTSYGQGGYDFADLLSAVCQIDGIHRVRYTTSHPKDFSDKLMDALAANPKVCHQLHLPLQSGSDAVLARMGRGYTYADYAVKIARIRSLIPDIAITTDLIVGFPGETEADFEATMAAVEQIGYLNLYGFKYSRRPGTTALALDGHLEEETKSRRLATLLSRQKAITLARYEALVGTTQNVLVEGVSRRNAARLSGRLASGVLLHFKGDADWVGSLRDVTVTHASVSALIGEPVDTPQGVPTAALEA